VTRRAPSFVAALVALAVVLPVRAEDEPSPAGAAPPATTAPPATGAPPAEPPAGTSRGATRDDERANAARALERALVEQGGLLLPQWGVELAPQFAYALTDQDAILPAEGGPVGAAARSHLVQGALTLRVGLPADLQAEASLPFVYVQRRLTLGEAVTRTDDETGIGDMLASLTWQPVRGRARFPDVLLQASWKMRTGRSPFAARDAIGLGSGLDDVAGAVTLVKPFDPLVLLGTLEYLRSLARTTPIGRVDAGGSFGVTLLAVLAVSPEASVTFGLDQRFAPRVRLAGAPVAGSDRTESVFRIGVATTTSRRGSLQLTVGMGLTRDVPQVQVSVAAPMQLR
jgi:hypothetical protein